MKFKWITLSLVLITLSSCYKDSMMEVGGPLGSLDVYNGDQKVSRNVTSVAYAYLKLGHEVDMPDGGYIDVSLFSEDGYELQWLGTLYDDGEKINGDQKAGDRKYTGSIVFSRYKIPGSYYMMATAFHNGELTSNKVYINYVE